MAKTLKQKSIPAIKEMPNIPDPLKILDWRAKARDFDRFGFDFNLKGEYYPLIWMDKAHRNFKQDTFGLYTVVGDPRMGPETNNGEAHEAITCLGAVLGGLMVDIDKTDQDGYDYVAMCKNYFNKENNWNIIMDYTSSRVRKAGGGYAGSFWYDLFPNILFFCIDSYCPGEKDFETVVHSCADQWQAAARVLNGDYQYTYFDFSKMIPVYNNRWREPDSAAGIAWLEYMAYKKFQTVSYLDTARKALEDLEKFEQSPFYEVLLPFGVLTAARMNAEEGTDFDLGKILNWCFTGESTCRPGWGVVGDRWGDYDAYGLQGSRRDSQGYVFAMNTYDMVAALLPMVRYAPQYARAIGKWVLNAANASRLFYPEELPVNNQTCKEYSELTRNLISYEGIRRYDKELLKSRDESEAKTRTPFAQGDSHRWGEKIGLRFPPISHLSLYGGVHIGILGGLVSKTNIDGIIKLDCLKSDFYHSPTHPTYLIYNPYDKAKEVFFNDDPREKNSLDKRILSPKTGKKVCFYDLIRQGFMPGPKSNQTKQNGTKQNQSRENDQTLTQPGRNGIVLEGNTAAVIVELPCNCPVEKRNGKICAGEKSGTIIGYI